VDDTRIAELTAEVLADLRTPAAPTTGTVGSGSSSLEARVESLEAALRALAPSAVAAVAVATAAPTVSTHVSSARSHPSLQLLPVPGGGDRCVLEPDKPCVSSGLCRTFGH
jgi:hypothetical protein